MDNNGRKVRVDTTRLINRNNRQSELTAGVGESLGLSVGDFEGAGVGLTLGLSVGPGALKPWHLSLSQERSESEVRRKQGYKKHQLQYLTTLQSIDTLTCKASGLRLADVL